MKQQTITIPDRKKHQNSIKINRIIALGLRFIMA